MAGKKLELAAYVPRDEASLVTDGISLWNVTDADRPQRLKKFREKQWPEWKRKLKPKLE